MKKSSWSTDDISDQKGKVIIITGATSGLGKEATRVLIQKNASVIMAVRNVKKGNDAKKEFLQEFPSASISVKELGLSSLESIKQFADTMNSELDKLDILINNAGVMMCPYSKTTDGFELQMGTNHLGPFALTGRLMTLLKKTPDSRVVVTSSLGHRQGKINFSDLNWENRKYKAMGAYADSKIANLFFTYKLVDKLKNDPQAPILCAAHPGWTRTELQRHSNVFSFLNNFFSQSVKDGTLPTLRAATDPNVKPGDYYGPSRFSEMHGSPIKVKSNELSHNSEVAQQLWDLSEQLTTVKY